MDEKTFRLVFDAIPEQFDRCRPHYAPALFDHLIAEAGLTAASRVLELGPGTGQATAPVLRTGCDYTAIELGEHLAAKMREKFGAQPNFRIICDDFLTHDFGTERFDLIYSAATIQWLPEEEAFRKTFALLRPGGMLAMMFIRGDYRAPNEALFQRIQQVYARHFRPEIPYAHRGFRYHAAADYGFCTPEERRFPGRREMTADEYADYCGTHCDHIVIPEPHRTQLYEGLREAVNAFGGRIVFQDEHVLITARKP